jgi:predicted GIY-YIG superfamily endonuclease
MKTKPNGSFSDLRDHDGSGPGLSASEEPIAPFAAPGIYAVVCTATGNAYVGSSGDCAQRLRAHLSCLRSQTHTTRKLLDEWNRHGELYFEFRFIERVTERNRLAERERYWISKMGTLNTRSRRVA